MWFLYLGCLLVLLGCLVVLLGYLLSLGLVCLSGLDSSPCAKPAIVSGCAWVSWLTWSLTCVAIAAAATPPPRARGSSGGSWRSAYGAEEAGGAPEPLGPPRCTFLPVDQGGRGGWSDGLATTVQDERTRRACQWESGSSVSRALGSVLLASHKACQEGGWFPPHGRGGVEKGGGSCPPMCEPSINLVV
mgnify:CR=1 FL=1